MTEPTRSYLLATWDGGGNVAPQLAVARRLLERGHRVHVLADPTVCDRAQAVGAGFSPWTTAPHRRTHDPRDEVLRDWEVSSPIAMLRNVRDRFMTGPAAAFAADTRAVVDVVDPDVVLVDSLILGAMAGAQGAGRPVAVLVPNIWMLPTPGCPTIGPGFAPARTFAGRRRDDLMRLMTNRIFQKDRSAFNAVRAQHGLTPLASLWDQVLGADGIYVLTSPTFDFAAPTLGEEVTYVGPVLDEPDPAGEWTSPLVGDPDDPLVLVGFSTTFQDQAAQLRRVVEALSRLPVRGVVTLGGAVEADEVPAAPNVAVVPSTPHGPLLRDAALAISHCGHGTTMKALAAGVPLVCLPMGRDQNDTAARVVHAGAGVRLPPRAGAPRIAAAVERVLADDTYRYAARRLAESIAAETRTDDLIARLEALGRHRTATA
ncbi:nucleotide disphospho-sugar-binding domain-containing protein [Rhabdothermincola salaria]|uniref:nucleotide disphospho-sugar-binding domain-containing protein n=1 Tax=Rhabdothermincola salaria TaxID=2903142 RepID=UPI001E2EA228|nr:nucleotide disphospho-sugar-binding domain-containing protein [Rhabdothermincola salaria]MCD9625212.1 hypothetical protein [Rhabdothermincola salaria]